MKTNRRDVPEPANQTDPYPPTRFPPTRKPLFRLTGPTSCLKEPGLNCSTGIATAAARAAYLDAFQSNHAPQERPRASATAKVCNDRRELFDLVRPN